MKFYAVPLALSLPGRVSSSPKTFDFSNHNNLPFSPGHTSELRTFTSPVLKFKLAALCAARAP